MLHALTPLYRNQYGLKEMAFSSDTIPLYTKILREPHGREHEVSSLLESQRHIAKLVLCHPLHSRILGLVRNVLPLGAAIYLH